ncbi:DUF1365 domain-containing protein [Actinomadura opuntiae]|uniref:DUF1365 domain-containing protein n=1 Tax=Actinomadura sp. OS1-43 TaxID=604315 RepID=UPI00255AB8F3|nr:DUF1365 domain-containing protein [Actinomadura sp. OS1-43]MDL4813211.1 DUF1365 domain-containing protein [Actinomadura sp. OS1-43]
MTSVPALVPALYECTLTHVRPGPVRNAFRYGTYLWLVDLDALPFPRGPVRFLAGFRHEDHRGEPGWSVRANLDAFLIENGVEPAATVLMLAHARVLGYVFNPLTVYWCFDQAGGLRCVVAEVHNTYGERHRYLLHTDAVGRAETDKAFYVSPFYPVEGIYRMSLPVPDRKLALAIALHRGDDAPFVAALRGARLPATTSNLVRAVLRHPMAPLVGAVRIRVQGVRLYLRGLRPYPRTHRQKPPGAPPVPEPGAPGATSPEKTREGQVRS